MLDAMQKIMSTKKKCCEVSSWLSYRILHMIPRDNDVKEDEKLIYNAVVTLWL